MLCKSYVLETVPENQSNEKHWPNFATSDLLCYNWKCQQGFRVFEASFQTKKIYSAFHAACMNSLSSIYMTPNLFFRIKTCFKDPESDGTKFGPMFFHKVGFQVDHFMRSKLGEQTVFGHYSLMMVFLGLMSIFYWLSYHINVNDINI